METWLTQIDLGQVDLRHFRVTDIPGRIFQTSDSEEILVCRESKSLSAAVSTAAGVADVVVVTAMAAAFVLAVVSAVTLAFVVLIMLAVAAMLAMTVMTAVGLAAVSQAAGQKGCNCLIGISRDPRVDFNAGLLQCIDCSAADTAADQDADSLFPQEAGQSTVAKAVCSDDAAGADCTVFNFIYLKSFCMAKVLKHLAVLVSDCNFHSVSSLRQRGHLQP